MTKFLKERSLRWSRALLRLALIVFALGAISSVEIRAQVTIAQISDTHLGEPQAPHAAQNLRRAVEMINARHPDAVILSGDIGENPDEWHRAREILHGLKEPLYMAPGNHDVHSQDVNLYRQVFGPDYYRFHVKDVTFLVIDSQLLGNFDQFEASTAPPLPPATEKESEQMFAWLSRQGEGLDADDHHGRESQHGGDNHRDDDHPGGIVIGIQHVPAFRDGNLPPDSKPYWVINEPYRSREIALLHKLGIRHMLVGHWHAGAVFEREGIVWHVAPTTSRILPWSGELGFAMHTIDRNGEVKTEFVSLGTAP